MTRSEIENVVMCRLFIDTSSELGRMTCVGADALSMSGPFSSSGLSTPQPQSQQQLSSSTNDRTKVKKGGATSHNYDYYCGAIVVGGVTMVAERVVSTVNSAEAMAATAAKRPARRG